MSEEIPQTPGLEPDERQELERLRSEVAELRRAEGRDPVVVGAAPATRTTARRFRSLLAGLLILVAVVLAPLSVVSVWARAQVTDTERYVETVAPLAQDPALQSAIAESITAQVFTYIDVKGLTGQALAALGQQGTLNPTLATQLEALSVPLANGVESFVGDQVLKVVQTDVFASAWREANRAAHQQLVAALTGDTDSAVQVEGDAVKVNMAAFLAVVKQQLIDNGFELATKIPVVQAEFTIFESADVGKVQRGFSILNALGTWLPFVLLALAGLGIYLATGHRRALLWTGLGLAVSMLLTGLALAAAREAYLNGVPPEVLPPDAAAVMYDTLVRYLRDAMRSAGLVGLFVAIGAFLSGPSVTSTTLRGWFASAMAAAKSGVATLGLDLTSVTRSVAPRAGGLRAAVLVVALVVILLERYRTPRLVITVAALAVLAIVLIEFLATPPRPPRSGPVADEQPVGLAVPVPVA